MHSIPYLVYPIFIRGGENEVSDNLAICGSVEGIALLREFLIKMLSINDVPVVGYAHSIGTATHYDRLNIDYPTGTSGRIAIMTNGNIPTEPS